MALGTVGLAWSFALHSVPFVGVFAFLFCFFEAAGNGLAGDIFGIEGDRKEGTTTIPQIVGRTRAVAIVGASLLLAVLCFCLALLA